MKHKVQPLMPGDTIDIIAPGAACTQDQVAQALLFINGLGYTPRVPFNLVGGNIPYHSQTDEVRFEHLYNALVATDSKAVWCLRGGYGSARLIPKLLDGAAPERAKLVIGYSDITAIHLFLMKQWGWPVLHAPVLFQVCDEKIEKESTDRVLTLLSGQMKEFSYTLIEPLNDVAKATHTIKASITGGNLSLLQTSIGTSWQVNADGQILFIEEIDEKGYSIDRMLTHLEQVGVLNKMKAVLIGDCDGPQHIDDTKNIAYALQRFADAHPALPVLRIKDIGHGKVNNPLPLGVSCVLTTGMSAKLQFDCREFYE